MSPLIAVREHNIGGVLQPTVDGRELFAFLHPNDMFANWIGRKVKQHKLLLGVDFERIKVLREIEYWRHRRVSHQVDYALTVSAAERIGAAEFCRGPVPWV